MRLFGLPARWVLTCNSYHQIFVPRPLMLISTLAEQRGRGALGVGCNVSSVVGRRSARMVKIDVHWQIKSFHGEHYHAVGPHYSARAE